MKSFENIKISMKVKLFVWKTFFLEKKLLFEKKKICVWKKKFKKLFFGKNDFF